MTFPMDVLEYYNIMSSYSSLDHDPVFPAHYLPSTNQLDRPPSSPGFKLPTKSVLMNGVLGFMGK